MVFMAPGLPPGAVASFPGNLRLAMETASPWRPAAPAVILSGRLPDPSRTLPSMPPAPKARSFDRRIVEGPIPGAVWRMAWPTMLQNVIGGLQGVIDHVMVGHYVGYTGNAAIGVSWQIFLVVIVFISSVFTGMGVLVARFTGQGDHEKVNRTVYQAFLTAAALSVGVMAPVGWFLAPKLLGLVNATAAVQAEALPYLRTMFVFGFGMMMFFMTGGAFRSAGDAQTPLRLGALMTMLNIGLNVVFIRGMGPIPAFGTVGAAMGTVIAGGVVTVIVLWMLISGHAVVGFRGLRSWRPDLGVMRELFRFGLPTGIQGVAMNVGGVFLLRFIGSLQQSAEAQAAYAVGYVELFSFITWTSVGLMGATAAEAVSVASRIGLAVAATLGAAFVLIPRLLLSVFGMDDPAVVELGVQLLRYLSVSGLFITVALAHTGGLQGTGDTKSPLYISLVSQLLVPLGLCFVLDAVRGLHPGDIWLAIVLGHATRCVLSVARFRQGKWRHIRVEIGPAQA
ncbi:MAG: MATE family efflux transporter [Gemmatimonadetes bacterium]|nr:MATE family efflux transporter [Gemmatimonadota bacterium]